jgi:hypothetical protein
MAEVPDHAHALRRGSPHRECDAFDTVDPARVCAEHLPQPPMGALSEEMEIELADAARKAVGILPIPDVAVGKVEAQPIAQRRLGFGQEAGEQPPRARRLHRDQVGFRQHQRRGNRVSVECAHHDARAPVESHVMGPQDPLRMGELARCQARRIGRLDRQCPGREQSFYLVPAHAAWRIAGSGGSAEGRRQSPEEADLETPSGNKVRRIRRGARSPARVLRGP